MTDFLLDNLLNNGLFIVEAEISFLSTEEGGRKTPVKSGYRPNHFFGEFGYMGAIILEEPLNPGESRNVKVAFLDVKELREELAIGKEWRIQEGGFLVGKGIILKLLSSI